MVPTWICCNSCFHPPAADRRLAVTTCGHIICQNCFRKGKQGECLICKAQCKVSPLSVKSRPEVKALFADVSVVAKKYLSEISKVLIFQMRHRKRLLSHFRQKCMKLEEVTKKMRQEMQKIHNMKAGQQSLRIDPSLGASMPTSLKQIPFPVEMMQTPSASHLVDRMDKDSQVLYRKPEISGSQPRLSLIHPPDGRMGTVQHRPNSQTSLVTHTASSASGDKLYKRSGCSQSALTTPSSSLSYWREVAWETPSFNPPPSFRHSSMSSLSVTLPLLSLQGRMPK